MPYTNTIIPVFNAWPSFVDPTTLIATLWRFWRTVDSSGTIRRHEGEDERVTVQSDGTFSFRGGPSFEDFPIPTPAADGIGLSIQLPDGLIFRSGPFDSLPAGPPTDPNGYVSVFLPEPITLTPANVASLVPTPPITIDPSTTVTAVSATPGTDVINVTGAGTDTRLTGVTFTFTFTATLAPASEQLNLARVLIFGISPMTLTFSGTGGVPSAIEAAIRNALIGWIEPGLRDTIRSRLQALLDTALARGIGRMPPLPANVVATVRRVGIRPSGITMVGALGSFGDLVAKFPPIAQPGGRCFIATAAYGSELAPEVQFLRELRDNLLRQTSWGRELFDKYSSYYYRISPAIAEQMHRDPELREIIRWTIVMPWVNYAKLLASRPNWDRIDTDELEPELREFLRQLRTDMEAWLSAIELPRSFAKHDPFEAAQELNVILGYVLRSGGLMYLDELIERGELPLRYKAQDEARLLHILRRAGRSEEETRRILYGRKTSLPGFPERP